MKILDDLDKRQTILNSVALMIFIGIIILILFEIFTSQDKKTIYTLIVPLGVLTSALLAANSVMKSIKNTKDIEDNKIIQSSKKDIAFFTINLTQIYRNLIILIDELDENKTPKVTPSWGVKLNHNSEQIIEVSNKIKNSINAIVIDKEILHTIDYEIMESFYKLCGDINKELLKIEKHIKNIESKMSAPNTKRIIKYRKEIEKIETLLVNKYGDDIPAIKLIFNEVYENTIF